MLHCKRVVFTAQQTLEVEVHSERCKTFDKPCLGNDPSQHPYHRKYIIIYWSISQWCPNLTFRVRYHQMSRSLVEFPLITAARRIGPAAEHWTGYSYRVYSEIKI